MGAWTRVGRPPPRSRGPLWSRSCSSPLAWLLRRRARPKWPAASAARPSRPPRHVPREANSRTPIPTAVLSSIPAHRQGNLLVASISWPEVSRPVRTTSGDPPAQRLAPKETVPIDTSGRGMVGDEDGSTQFQEDTLIHLLLAAAIILFIVWLIFFHIGTVISLLWIAILVALALWIFGFLFRGRRGRSGL